MSAEIQKSGYRIVKVEGKDTDHLLAVAAPEWVDAYEVVPISSITDFEWGPEEASPSSHE